MKIIKEQRLNEAGIRYEIRGMIEDGSIYEYCNKLIDNLKNIVETFNSDDLAKYCTKYVNGAADTVIEIGKWSYFLENIQKKSK